MIFCGFRSDYGRSIVTVTKNTLAIVFMSSVTILRPLFPKVRHENFLNYLISHSVIGDKEDLVWATYLHIELNEGMRKQ